MESKGTVVKRALITGGSKGIGKEIALKFARNGIDIGIIGRNLAGLNTTRLEIEKLGRDCLVIQADLSEIKQVSEAGNIALEHSPVWNILINNAGIANQVPLLELSLSDWDNTINTNLRSVLLLSQIIVPQMINRREGKIINISSTGAFYGTKGMGAYAVTKAGLNQITRTMAVEWGPYNIQTNAICPTIIWTELASKIWSKPENQDQRNQMLKRIPAGRFGETKDVAGLALFLAGNDSDFINGVAIPLDGGKIIMP